MKNRLLKFMFFSLAVCSALCVLIACGVEFKVNFVVDGEVYSAIDTKGGETVKMPDNPAKEDYIFDGWFWDKDVWEKPFTANSLLDAPLSSDMSVYAKFTKKHEHSYTATTTDPTCADKGYTTYTCDCGDSFVDSYTNALDHDYSAVVTDPTCTEQGYTTHTCSRCGDSFVDSFTDALDHEFVNYVSDNNATYDSDGTKTAHCNRGCGATDTLTDGGTKLKSEIAFRTLSVNGNNVYGKVPNEQTTFSFIDEVEIKGNATFVVSSDIYGIQQIPTKTVPLIEGDNTFYITETVGNNIRLFTVVIRRRLIYIVSFDVNGGSAVVSQSVEEDGYATEPTTTRAGYSFAGWDYDFNTPITDNTEITASWTVHTDTPYKAEYYLQNLEDDNYTLQESATEFLTGTTDTTAYAEIKIFEHFTHTVISQSLESGNISGDGSTVLKVYYTRNKYAYTATNGNMKGGSINCTANETYKYDTEISLKALVNAGYDFTGWYIGETKVSDEAEYNFSLVERTDITAKWQAHTNTPYKVEYYLENLGNNDYTLTDTAFLSGTTDTTAFAEIKTFEHFTARENIVSGNISGDGSTVLKVFYTRDKYAYTATNGNLKGGGINCTPNGTYKFDTEITLKASVNAGYDFTGWYSGETKVSSEAEYNFSLVERTDITAKWQAHTNTPYKVEYYLENLENNYYTLTDTAFLSGTTDTTAYAEIKAFKHFTHTTVISQCLESGNINGYGSTVLKVYYTRNKYNVNISATTSVSLSRSYSGQYKYGYKIDEIKATFYNYIGYEWTGWFNGEEFISAEKSLPAMIVDNDINYYACCSIKEEMSCFKFTSTENTCSITGIKKGVTEIIIPTCVTSIGKYAFRSCSSLTSVTIPDSVTSIGDSAFSGCSSLTSVVIPNSVKSIGGFAFYGCSSLESINIPDSVTSIGGAAFEYCSSLTSMVIPVGVMSIGGSLFAYCSSLTSIKISNRVTIIDQSAFYGCSSLTRVNYDGTKKEWNSISKGDYWKNNVPSSCKVYCTDGVLSI